MKITFDNWIKNPTGGTSVLTNTQVYKTLYTEKLDKILVRQAGEVNYRLYYDKAANTYYCYMKIWSEVIHDFSYDVLIQFYSDSVASEADTNLEKYYVRFFSNDPAFVFTFAHAYYKNDLFIKDFESKMSKLAITDKAKTKNPKDEIGFVKSLYFAYLIMKSRGLFLKVAYKANGAKYEPRYIAKDIMQADLKIEQRQDKELLKVKADKVIKAKQQVTIDNKSRATNPDLFTGNSGNVRTTKNVNTISRSSNVKKTNKIGRK